MLLFAAITGIENWETPGYLGAALAFGGIVSPALPVLVTRLVRIKRLVRTGERAPCYLIEREHDRARRYIALHRHRTQR